jgi:hypothetical protein
VAKLIIGAEEYDKHYSVTDPFYGYQSDKMQFLVTTSKSVDSLEQMYDAVGGPSGLFTDIQM